MFIFIFSSFFFHRIFPSFSLHSLLSRTIIFNKSKNLFWDSNMKRKRDYANFAVNSVIFILLLLLVKVFVLTLCYIANSKHYGLSQRLKSMVNIIIIFFFVDFHVHKKFRLIDSTVIKTRALVYLMYVANIEWFLFLCVVLNANFA